MSKTPPAENFDKNPDVTQETTDRSRSAWLWRIEATIMAVLMLASFASGFVFWLGLWP